MENWRVIRVVHYVLTVLIVLVVCFPSDVLAWDNQTVHPQVNRSALELFETLKNNDPFLINATLNGAECWGEAWDPENTTDLFHAPPAVKKRHFAGDWITWGGFSADEPEGPMALRHFYNPYPPDNPRPWLTDQQQIVNFLRTRVSSTIRNPEISLIGWAENQEKGWVDEYFLPQRYSWNDAKEYFKQALADTDASNVNYGKAWRAVGETMHLFADLTLPPHVRNDGHASFLGGRLGDADPAETSTTAEHVLKYYSASGGWSTAINYNQDVIKMMRQIANWTNTNFLSKDTIPITGSTVTANGGPAFPSPSMAGRTPDRDGYVWYDVDDHRIRMARTSWWYRWSLSKNPGFFLDSAVIADQRSLLLPTAVRAAEAVLERFLPRFSVEAKATQDSKVPGRYQVHAVLTQGQDEVTNYEWQKYGRLAVRNGAQIIVNDKQVIPVRVTTSDEKLNEFTRDISPDSPGANPKFVVRYDFGGYVVQSDPVKLQSPPQDTGNYCFRMVVVTGPREGIEYNFTVALNHDSNQYGPFATNPPTPNGFRTDKICLESGAYNMTVTYGQPPYFKRTTVTVKSDIPNDLEEVRKEGQEEWGCKYILRLHLAAPEYIPGQK
ncbi:MAG: hypothetical protein NTY79_07395 [Chloroflexi bacterium]|nr:hypothetical protein [Chloroflexota bacterium]